MDRLKCLFSLIVGCLFIFPTLNAQSGSKLESSPPEEIIKIITSDDILVSGSELFFQILVINANNNSLSTLSQNISTALYNSNGERLVNQKITLEKGVGNGKMFINSSLSSGVYRIIAASNWSLNNEDHTPIAQKDIIIINPFQNTNQSISKDSVNINYFEPSLPSQINQDNDISDITMQTNSELYKFREKVALNVENTIAYRYPFSISVKKVKPISVVRPKNEIEFEVDQNNFFIPEIRGSLVRGKIIPNNKDLQVEDQMVALSIPGKQYVVKLLKTDDTGQFYFNLDDNEYKYEDLYVYVVGRNQNEYKITLKSPTLDHLTLEKRPSNLVINDELKNWILSNSIANQIENAYFEAKADSAISTPIKKPFYAPLGVVYVLDNYTRFRTVNETFIEIIENAALRKEGDNYVFKTYNRNEQGRGVEIANLRPLILLDGIVISDNSVLVNYDAHKIEKITVVPDNYRYGSEIYAGIIDVTTINGDFGKNSGLKSHPFLYPIVDQDYYQPNYTDNLETHIPDYRTQLYWDHQVDLTEALETEISFFTSDIEGWFEIVLKGYDNNGKEVTKIKNFKVE